MFAAVVPWMVILASAWAPSVFPSRTRTPGSSVGKVRATLYGTQDRVRVTPRRHAPPGTETLPSRLIQPLL